MSIKTILCMLGGSNDELNAVNTAFLLGKQYQARIRFLHVSPHPAFYIGWYGEGAIGAASIMATVEKENAQRMELAKCHVTTLSAKHAVPLDESASLQHHASAKFVHLTGFLENTVRREGHLSDLIIIGRPQAGGCDFITPALFTTGRPVLLVPGQEKPMMEWAGKIIAVAWKGTEEAMRAIYHAMPFLERAEKVYVLTAEEDGETYDLAAEAALLEYLGSHNVHAQGIVVATGQLPAPEALLSRARDLHADLLVMGAYGHSQFREMILGGVTEYMLEHATIPLLLSH